MSKQALQKAVAIVGGQVRLAEAIRARIPGSKINQPHISGWLNSVKMEVPPAETVIAICESCGWQITPHELRDDIYPNADDGLPAGDDLEPAVYPIECASGDPRHGAERRRPEQREAVDRRKEAA